MENKKKNIYRHPLAFLFIIMSGLINLIFITQSLADSSPWLDSYYPYRTSITVNVPSSGEYLINITPDMITNWANDKTDFAFKSKFFAFNNIKLVEVDASGTVTNGNVNAGYCMALGQELVKNGGFEQVSNGQPTNWSIDNTSMFSRVQNSYNGSWCMNTTGADRYACAQFVSVKPNTYYQFSAWADHASIAPYYYKTGAWVETFDVSYDDPYIPETSFRNINSFFYVGDKSNWSNDSVQIRMEHYTGKVDDISMKECKIGFYLKADLPGTKRYMLYYSPLEGVKPIAPAKILSSLPTTVLQFQQTTAMECIDEDASGLVGDPAAPSAWGDLWWAPTVRKVMENSPVPSIRKSKITVSCAKNESEAIQLVFHPKGNGTLTSVNINLTGPDGYVLNCDVRRAKYVPIITNSLTRSEFTGRLPDPLPEFSPVNFTSSDPNIPIWIDIKTPKTAPAGKYTGNVVVQSSEGSITVPVELTVWNFTLPDSPTCRSSFQFSRYGNFYLFPYHKVTTDADKYALCRAYYSTMAKYKMSDPLPTTSATYYTGTKPPGNYWMEDVELPWYFDTKKMNAVSITHVSGPSLSNATVESSRPVAESYDPLAAHYAQKNWLDKSFIMIDEPQPNDYPGVRNWIQAFRNQPNAKDISMFIFVYHGESWDALKNSLDIIVPQNDEAGNAMSPKAASLYPNDKDIWLYWVYSCHQYIDAPGIDQRLMGPKAWAMGAKGVASWILACWWDEAGNNLGVHNPWENPGTPWGNGVASYFYPPSVLGTNLPSKDMTIIPSLRLIYFRDGLEDYEYGVKLKSLIDEAKSKSIDTTQAESALNMLKRPFTNPVNWTLGETYWMQAREAVAKAIEDLTVKIQSPPAAAYSWDLSNSWSDSYNLTNNWTVGYLNTIDNTFTPYSESYTVSSGGASESRWGDVGISGATWIKGYAINGNGPFAMVEWGRRSEVGRLNSLVAWDGTYQFVAKWTAPTAGDYNISALFSAQKYGIFFERHETRARVNVIKVGINNAFSYLNPTNSLPYPGELLEGFYGSLPDRTDAFGSRQSYNYTGQVSLLAGESIYLTTAQALSGGYFTWDYDAVGISSTISKVLPTSSLSGTVILGNFSGDITTIPLTIELGNDIAPITVNLDANGKFIIHDIPNGTYNMRIKAPHWLSKIINITVNGDTSIGSIGTN